MKARIPILLSALLIVAAAVYVNLFMGRAAAQVPREPVSVVPRSIDGWEGSDQPLTSKVLQNLKVDEYLMRRYELGGEEIWLYVGYYGSQREGSAPHSPRHCYPGAGFHPIRNDIVPIPVESPGRKEIRANRFLFGKGQERELVIYWYQSRGRVNSSEYVEKFHLVLDTIFRNRSDGALVRFSTPTSVGSEEEASRRLERFISRVYPYIPRTVPD